MNHGSFCHSWNWSGYRESNPDRKLGRLSSDLRYPQLRVFPRCLPKTIQASTPLCTDLAAPVSRHPVSIEVRVRGLPGLFSYVALSGYRRPGLPEGCPGYR